MVENIKRIFSCVKANLPVSNKNFSKVEYIAEENREKIYDTNKALHELYKIVQMQNEKTIEIRDDTSKINEKIVCLSNNIVNRLEEMISLSKSINMLSENQTTILNSITDLEYRIMNSDISNLKNYIADLKRDISKNQNILTYYKKQMEMMFWSLYKADGENIFDTQKRFFIELPKASGELRYLQILETVLLKKLKEICNKNNLSYWLWGGSLLGAIRHAGFIPWDDDIDIGMPRRDLLILQDLLERDSSFVLRIKYDAYVNCRQVRMQFREPNIPAFIDIFPFDYTNEEKEDKIEHIKMEMLEELSNSNEPEIVLYRNNLLTEEETNEGGYIKGIFKKYHDKLIAEESTNDISKKYIFYGIDNYNPKRTQILPIDTFLPLKLARFEGEEYYIPNKALDVLDDLYGNIYSLPDGEPHFDHIDLKGNRDSLNKFLKDIRDKKLVLTEEG